TFGLAPVFLVTTVFDHYYRSSITGQHRHHHHVWQTAQPGCTNPLHRTRSQPSRCANPVHRSSPRAIGLHTRPLPLPRQHPPRRPSLRLHHVPPIARHRRRHNHGPPVNPAHARPEPARRGHLRDVRDHGAAQPQSRRGPRGRDRVRAAAGGKGGRRPRRPGIPLGPAHQPRRLLRAGRSALGVGLSRLQRRKRLERGGRRGLRGAARDGSAQGAPEGGGARHAVPPERPGSVCVVRAGRHSFGRPVRGLRRRWKD
ncbi:hypothetical protein GE09DRAFT_34066, partial [Coniochaeta sp. 2T2.1]